MLFRAAMRPTGGTRKAITLQIPVILMSRKPRIAVDPDVLRALRIWAAHEGEDADVLASQIIRDALPSEVWQFQRRGISEARASEHSEKSKKSAGKSKMNEEVVAQIKGAWGKGIRKNADIVRETGVPDHKVSRYVKAMKEQGELQD